MKGNPSDVREIDEGESYLEYYIDQRSLAESSENNVRYAWQNLQSFLNKHNMDVEEIGEQDALDFCQYLKNKQLKEESGHGYVQLLAKMIDWLIERRKADYNPFRLALEDDPFEYDGNSVKRNVKLADLRSGVSEIDHPAFLVFVTLLLKTGVRISEACNLDYRAINLDHPAQTAMPRCRAEIIDKPNSLFIDSSISAGEKHNSEYRNNGNKKDSYRAIPIDKELQDALVWLIAMNPPSPSPAQPLFRALSGGGGTKIGERYSADTLRERFRQWSAENGWYDQKRDLSSNVTPHWCRHWFTTTLRREIDNGEVEMGNVKDYVGALRGDQDSRTVDIYTHNWSDEPWVREAYVNNIPKLFVESDQND